MVLGDPQEKVSTHRLRTSTLQFILALAPRMFRGQHLQGSSWSLSQDKTMFMESSEFLLETVLLWWKYIFQFHLVDVSFPPV